MSFANRPQQFNLKASREDGEMVGVASEREADGLRASESMEKSTPYPTNELLAVSLGVQRRVKILHFYFSWPFCTGSSRTRIQHN